MTEQISVEEAHQIVGELLFSYKILEKQLKQKETYWKNRLESIETENEQLKGEIFQLRKALNGPSGKGDSGQ